MRTQTKDLLGILALVFVVGFAIRIGTTIDDIMLLAALASIVLWIVALVNLLRRRDVDIHDKLTWVVTVLLLNGIGAILYFIFGPERQPHGSRPTAIDPDARPIAPESESWNPILGVNHMAKGQGLNPRDNGITEPES
jgi:hypothetical protein